MGRIKRGKGKEGETGSNKSLFRIRIDRAHIKPIEKIFCMILSRRGGVAEEKVSGTGRRKMIAANQAEKKWDVNAECWGRCCREKWRKVIEKTGKDPLCLFFKSTFHLSNIPA